MKIQLSENVIWTDETFSSRDGIGCINDGTQDYGPKDVFPWDKVVITHDTVTGKELPEDRHRSRTVCEWVFDWWVSNGFRSDAHLPSSGSIKILRRWQRQWPESESLKIQIPNNHEVEPSARD